MTTMQKEQVRRFYDVLWNAHDKGAIPRVLGEDFTFRGSLGDEKRGHAGFAEYLDAVHGALADYRCTIEELVEEGERVFAKVRFAGVHRGELLGYPPTGDPVAWVGCALFRFAGERIVDAWVLGDLAALEAQLRRNAR